MDSFTGSWVANLAKSQRHSKHQFRDAVMQFKVEGDQVTLAYSGTNAEGKQESGTTVLHTDGREHEISPEAPGVVVVSQWAGTRRIETMALKDGEVIGGGSYEVSADGNELTATVSGIDASGAAFDQIIVFDRQAGDENLVSIKRFNIGDTFVALDDSRGARPLPVTDDFWPALQAGRFGQFSRLVSAFSYDTDWTTWEKHPAGEEFVCLVEGKVDLVLEIDGREHVVTLDQPGAYVLVPKDTWHTARVHRPARMFFITPGEGTQNRPA